MATYRIRLTAAQRSALECRMGGGLDDCPTLLAGWGMNHIAFDDADALCNELCAISNAEDAHAEETRCVATARSARGASAALANIMQTVLDAVNAAQEGTTDGTD